MKKFLILTMATLVMMTSASTCFAGKTMNKENIVTERIPITFEGNYSNNSMANMTVTSKAKSNDLAKYFSGYSEKKVEYQTIGSYNLYSKRAVASSKGYVGHHFLKAYVDGYDYTMQKKYSEKGFTLCSGWASQPSVPVLGTAICKYGYK